MTTVSIALATYNGERYLEEQLESLLAQTLPPSEVVVGDDGSSDRTVTIVERVLGRASFPVRIFRNDPRLGFERNFLQCAARCGGDLVAFCDQDDVWHPDKLRRMRDRIDATKSTLAFHEAWVWRSAEAAHTLYGGHLGAADGGLSLFGSSILGFTQVVDRRVFSFNAYHERSKDPRRLRHVEAHDQWTRFIAELLTDVDFVPQPLARYRQHQSNAFGAVRDGSLISHMKASNRHHAALWFCVRGRLDVLNQIELDGRSGELPRFDEVRSTYVTMDRRLGLRRCLYGPDSVSSKLAALRRLLALGAYRGKSEGVAFGLKGLAKDLVVGVCLSPLLQQADQV